MEPILSRTYFASLVKYPEEDLGWEEPQEGVRPAPNRKLRRRFPRLEAISFIHVVKRFPIVEYFDKLVSGGGGSHQERGDGQTFVTILEVRIHCCRHSENQQYPNRYGKSGDPRGACGPGLYVSERGDRQCDSVGVRTCGVGPGGCQYVLLQLAWVHTHSCPFQSVDGNGGFEYSTLSNLVTNVSVI
jgi:hypothetical protein